MDLIFALLIVIAGGKYRGRLTHNLATQFVCMNTWGTDEEGMNQDRVMGVPGLGGSVC